MKKNFNYINRCLKDWKKKATHSLSIIRGLYYNPIPDVIVTLSYSQFYKDFRAVKPQDFLKGIPTFDALSYVLALETKVHYTLHDPSVDASVINYFKSHSPIEESLIIDKTLTKHKLVTLINSEGTLRFVRLALSCYTSEVKGFQLNDEQIHSIIKAYLYCNQLWTNEQNNPSMQHFSNLVDVSLKIDLPFSEFKFFKDFRTQLYKSIKLFEFAENDKDVFAKILPIFCSDRKVADWKEYIRILFGFFEPSLNTPLLDMSTAPLQVKMFMQPFIMNVGTDVQKDNLKGVLPLFYRDKFLLRSTLDPNKILILSSDLLVDKFYQGLKFDFGTIAANNGIKDAKGHDVTQKTINSLLGSSFSEEKILYSVLELIYGTHSDVVLKSGSITKPYFKNNGDSEPDYYWRKGSNLVLFENKDVLFPDPLKSSTPLILQKNSISSKLARFGKYLDEKKKLKDKKEGLGQIFFNIFRIAYQPELYRAFDPGIDFVDTIYPVLVTYDKTYSALGVNAFVNKRISGIKQRLTKTFKQKFDKEKSLKRFHIQPPVIIDIDTLIMYSLVFKQKTLDILMLINQYNGLVPRNVPNLSSFYTFIIDKYRLAPQGEEFVKSLYGDIIEVTKQ